MRPFFRFYGSKWSAVPRYPAPQHALVVEPFAGSASYAVRHEPPRVLLCDRDPYIVGVWRYLIGASAAEIYRFGSRLLDFPALGEWCRTRPGQVIVCENEGAGWLPFAPLAATHSSHTGKTTNREAVWFAEVTP